MNTFGDLHSAWRALPFGSLNDIIGNGTCLVLAPHPDDESLGCGGLIAACCAADRPPLVVILTDGAGSHPRSRAFPPNRLREVRAQEARDAVAHLGLPPERIRFLGHADTAAPSEGSAFTAAVEDLTALIRGEADCSAILAPWLHDPHGDHQAASRIAASVAKHCAVKRVEYPIWGWTLPTEASAPASAGSGWRLDITAWQSQKRRAISAHRTQYGGLITDDPAGFELPTALLSAFDVSFEVFLHTPGDR